MDQAAFNNPVLRRLRLNSPGYLLPNWSTRRRTEETQDEDGAIPPGLVDLRAEDPIVSRLVMFLETLSAAECSSGYPGAEHTSSVQVNQ